MLADAPQGDSSLLLPRLWRRSGFDGRRIDPVFNLFAHLITPVGGVGPYPSLFVKRQLDDPTRVLTIDWT